jgi:hypothetical protein
MAERRAQQEVRSAPLPVAQAHEDHLRPVLLGIGDNGRAHGTGADNANCVTDAIARGDLLRMSEQRIDLLMLFWRQGHVEWQEPAPLDDVQHTHDAADVVRRAAAG